VTNFRASTRTAVVVTAVAALVLGLFAASALAWSGGEETTPTGPTAPTGPTTPTGPTSPQDQPATPPAAELAPPPVVAVPPTPAAPQPPDVEVKGNSGTPDVEVKGNSGTPDVEVKGNSGTPDVEVKGKSGTRGGGETLAAAGEVAQTPAGESGEALARTGFDLLFVAILGGLALGGSAFLFWRSRTI
jgi:hypothetical protein